MYQRAYRVYIACFLLFSWLVACTTAPPPSVSPQLSAEHLPHTSFRTQAQHAPEPPASPFESVTQVPANPAFELVMQTGNPVANTLRLPEQGSFELRIQAGSPFALLDADASDGEARLQVPSEVMDLYLQPEQSPSASICQPLNPPSTASVSDQMDQLVLDKAQALIAAGQAQCVYLPPLNQRQNANCNSNSSGLQCNGPLNKTINKAQCPEIAVYAGAMNLNHDLSSSKLFVATSNNLTLNQSAKGILTTRGNLNTSLNNSSRIEGLMVGGSSNNLNLSSSAEVKGLYYLANNSSLSANLNGNARLEGALCSTGNLNVNRNGSSQTIYHPNLLEPWLSDMPQLANLVCEARPNFYTQTIPKSCPVGQSATLDVADSLYGIEQTLAPVTEGSGYKLPGRHLPIQTDWYSADGQEYVLRFENHGMTRLTAKWFQSPNEVKVPASVKVIPAVDCVKAQPGGGYIAYLSYTNLMPGPVSLPLGSGNHFSPAPVNPGSLTQFEPAQSAVYPNSPGSIQFHSAQLSWQLGARVVTIEADAPELQCPQESQSPDLLIEDVKLSETGESIMGTEAPGSIQPDYAGKEIRLTLSGTFKDAQEQALPLADFLFSLAPPLVQQTFIGTAPAARVLLDESILLETESVSASEIQVVLETEKLPDMYLKGLHKLSVEQGDWYTDTLIQVGDPVAVDDLSPRIDSVEILRDSSGQAQHLKLRGQHFMVYPKFSYATIDGEFGFGFQTEVLMDGSSETVVHVPHPETFDQQTEHVVIMATPFGVCFKEFE